MLPVRHPDVFSVFGDYSGFAKPTLDPPEDALQDLFLGNQAQMDEYDTTMLIPGHRFDNVSGWFETGSEDPDPLQPTKDVAQLATAAGMTTCLVIRPGGHDFTFWEQAFRNSLPWMSWRLDVADKPPEVPGAQCTYH
jgi:S-formylglutathione hydrolase FrmB